MPSAPDAVTMPLLIAIGDSAPEQVAEFDMPLDPALRPAAIASVLRALAREFDRQGVPDAAAHG